MPGRSPKSKATLSTSAAPANRVKRLVRRIKPEDGRHPPVGRGPGSQQRGRIRSRNSAAGKIPREPINPSSWTASEPNAAR